VAGIAGKAGAYPHIGEGDDLPGSAGRGDPGQYFFEQPPRITGHPVRTGDNGKNIHSAHSFHDYSPCISEKVNENLQSITTHFSFQTRHEQRTKQAGTGGRGRASLVSAQGELSGTADPSAFPSATLSCSC
jgi:hypothetical protein